MNSRQDGCFVHFHHSSVFQHILFFKCPIRKTMETKAVNTVFCLINGNRNELRGSTRFLIYFILLLLSITRQDHIPRGQINRVTARWTNRAKRDVASSMSGWYSQLSSLGSQEWTWAEPVAQDSLYVSEFSLPVLPLQFSVAPKPYASLYCLSSTWKDNIYLTTQTTPFNICKYWLSQQSWWLFTEKLICKSFAYLHTLSRLTLSRFVRYHYYFHLRGNHTLKHLDVKKWGKVW